MILNGLRGSLIVILLSIHFLAAGQSDVELSLLFSRNQMGGSSRIQAMGGAQVSLGGDYSSVLSNPAGLGMYNRSEFTVTPALSTYSTHSNYGNNRSDENSSKFNIPGLSYVRHIPAEKGGFLGGSFGVSMTRTNDFNGSIYYEGQNNDNSIIDYFMDQANGHNISQFGNKGDHYNSPVGLAYFTYLIGPQTILDPSLPDDQYFTDAPIASIQKESIINKGNTYQWSISYGGNLNDKFFFGGGIGLTSIKYKSQKVFSEDYLDNDILKSILLAENIDLQGSGVNATFGAIVRPTNFIQVGLSFVTPTLYQLTKTYDASLDAYWNNYDYDDGTTIKTLNDEYALTDIVVTEYSLVTPLKLSTGVTFISKYGFITGDIEMVNPSRSKFRSDMANVSFADENRQIRGEFTKTYNFRVGGEFRYKMFRLRGGYNVLGNPYANKDYKQKNISITGGAGIRLEKFYLDLTLISRTIDSYYSPYTLINTDDSQQPIVKLNNKLFTSMITFGFTF